MTDHETTLRELAGYLLRTSDLYPRGSVMGQRQEAQIAACEAGADALRREKETADAVHYYTGEDVDELVQRYRDDPPAMMPFATEPTR